MGVNSGEFYAYKVKGEKSEEEFGVFMNHEDALKKITARFGGDVTTNDDLKHINVGETINYVIKKEKTLLKLYVSVLMQKSCYI